MERSCGAYGVASVEPESRLRDASWGLADSPDGTLCGSSPGLLLLILQGLASDTMEEAMLEFSRPQSETVGTH